jgi:cytochrome P450
LSISPAPPRAAFALPWDDPTLTDPVGALARARADLGDTFELVSGADQYLFVFSPDALRALYALPERDASKGLADYRMLVRKLPEELFAGVRTMAHDLFGAQDVETYLGHLDHALALTLDELGDRGDLDAFAFARRIGHRLGLACWIGDRAAEQPWFDRLVAELDRLDGADAFVHPDQMLAVASTDKATERAALARYETMVGELLTDGTGDGFLREIASRWSDTAEPRRTQGIARDVALLHVATMTNLFAALGWTIALLALHPGALARVRTGDSGYVERSALEAIRIGQCSVILRSVMRDIELNDGTTTYHLSAGVTLGTMLALTNTTALDGLDAFDPDRWEGRRLRAERSLAAREAVATFGFGPHRCPAQRFSLSAITRVVRGLADRYDLEPRFSAVRPIPEQIGGVSRAADPCPISYRAR